MNILEIAFIIISLWLIFETFRDAQRIKKIQQKIDKLEKLIKSK